MLASFEHDIVILLLLSLKGEYDLLGKAAILTAVQQLGGWSHTRLKEYHWMTTLIVAFPSTFDNSPLDYLDTSLLKTMYFGGGIEVIRRYQNAVCKLNSIDTSWLPLPHTRSSVLSNPLFYKQDVNCDDSCSVSFWHMVVWRSRSQLHDSILGSVQMN